MRRFAITIALLISAGIAIAEEKPIATRAAEALQPAAKAYQQKASQTALEFMAGTGDGAMADGARRALQQQKSAPKGLGNTSIVRSTKDCMKPGNVIDKDVQECTQGLREKDW